MKTKGLAPAPLDGTERLKAKQSNAGENLSGLARTRKPR